MTEVFTLKPKTYSYLIDNGDKNKKAKTHKKYVIKQKINFEDDKPFLKQINLKIKRTNYKK